LSGDRFKGGDRFKEGIEATITKDNLQSGKTLHFLKIGEVMRHD